MSESRAVRRRVEEPKETTEGRTGCLVAGAVLGVVAGVLFTFFGLPPLLDRFFGETHVGGGEAYEGDAKVIRVTSVGVGAPPEAPATPPAERLVAFVVLSVRTNKTWRPTPSDFRLEIAAGDRIRSGGPNPAVADSGLDFELGKERTLTLLFELPRKVEIAPRYLHLSDPPVRFELPEPSR